MRVSIDSSAMEGKYACKASGIVGPVACVSFDVELFHCSTVVGQGIFLSSLPNNNGDFSENSVLDELCWKIGDNLFVHDRMERIIARSSILMIRMGTTGETSKKALAYKVAETLSCAMARELVLADLKQAILSARLPAPQPAPWVNASNRGCTR